MSTTLSTTARSSARHETRSLPRPHPLFAVIAWELRRYRASRLFWLQALLFFGLILLVMRLEHNDVGTASSTFLFSGAVALSSPWGLLDQLPSGLLLMLCLILPFVMADGVSRDLSRRTHELLMTTPVPNWAYVWGRYLVGVLISLGLALLLLAAILGMGMVLHLLGTNYPTPELGPVLLLWFGIVVTATVVVSSLSFALGTVFLRQATWVKISIMLAWFVGAFALPTAMFGADRTTPPAWYVNWDPTSAATKFGLLPQYEAAWQSQAFTATSLAQAQRILDAVENIIPSNTTWLAPHLILAVGSLLLVLLAALSFQRFRGALSAS
jgi:ABC-type transport system involved in multi-copper enzyme maturation permease subunit